MAKLRRPRLELGAAISCFSMLLLIISFAYCQTNINTYEDSNASPNYNNEESLNQNQSNLFLFDYSVLAADDDNINNEDSEATSRSIWRRQVFNGEENMRPFEPIQNLDYDSYRPLEFRGQQQQAPFVAGSLISGSGLDSPVAQSMSLQNRRSFFADAGQQTLLAPNISNSNSLNDFELQERAGNQFENQQQKVGPQFIKEPPSIIHYLNSSDLVIPCAASGQPPPTISWWHKSSQLEIGSLLDRRYVRYDNSLVISAFKEQQYEPEIHSTTYKCQASNPWGSIVSRDVVINAVIDHEYEVSVGDQFVTVDNDAAFKCQMAPQVRDFYQVIGWLEDGQHLVQAPQSTQQFWSNLEAQQLGANRKFARHHQAGPQQGPTSPGNQQRAFVLPDGQLYVQRVQLKDANKSFRCQIRNLLNSRTSLSPISGRLFVTDASESGAAPRIVDAPKAISVGKLNEQLLLTCLAQGSPRPTIRWFRQSADVGVSQEWTEIPATDSAAAAAAVATTATMMTTPATTTTATTSPASDQIAAAFIVGASGANAASGALAKYVISSDANLLLIRSLQPADNRAKFKCLANNTFGMHFAETELRLELWPQSRLLELEPKLNFIDNGLPTATITNGNFNKHSSGGNFPSQQTNVAFNCTIKGSPSDPLIAIEWLKNGKLLFSVSLAQYAHQLTEPIGGGGAGAGSPGAGYLLNGSQLQSMFDEPNLELSLIENRQQLDQADGDAGAGDESSLETIPGGDDELAGPSLLAGSNYQVSQTTLNKLSNSFNSDQQQQQILKSHRRRPSPGPRQRLRLIARDQLLYQLHFDSAGPRRADRGSYQCRARTVQTTLQATSQLMLKDNPPQFVETFPSQLLTKLAGQGAPQPQASLKCIASGSPLPEISWTLSGVAVPESSRFRVGDYVTRDGLIVSFVNITNVQPEDGGLYECSASNDVGQLRHAAWLNVTGPLQVRPMPNVSAVAGRSLSIMCPVGGWPVEQISWFQNATKLPLNHRQKLFPNGTLLISDLNEVTDSGRYSCQAKQSSASDTTATNHVHISIKVPPVVEPFAFARSLHRGQRYNVMCTVVRGDLPVSIRWFKDGRPIEAAGQLQQQQQHLMDPAPVVADSPANLEAGAGIAIKQLDPYSSTLTFASLQAHHRGVYSCEATNEAGRANQSSSLVIHVPPEWRIEPRDMSVTVGRTAVVDCQADAFPAARVEWRLSQDLFREPPSEFKPISSSLYMRVFENGSLIIYNTQRTDAGYYLCQASNGVGPGLSRVVKLTVHVAAHFKSKIRTELVRRGNPARLKCESIGDLPIEINWLKDKMPLYASDEPRYALTKTMLADGLVSELTIGETERSDSALFTCITQNQFGSDDTNIQLLVQSVPDPPLDIRIHDYEARSVKISWLVGHTGNAPISRFVISYAQLAYVSPQPFEAATHNPQYTNITVAGNESSVLLQSLTPLTEYQFYMVAVNSLGSSKAPNEPIKFRTDDEAPGAPPLFVKAQPVSSRAIRVSWRAPERRAHYGSVSGFYVGYKVHRPEANGADTFIYKTVELTSGGQFGELPSNRSAPTTSTSATTTTMQQSVELECQLSGLRRAHKYLITVQAFNSRGAGPASEPTIAETWLIDVPEPPILRLVARTTRSIHLAWRLAPVSSSVETSDSSKRVSVAPPANKDLDSIERQAEEAQANEPILGFILTRKPVVAPGEQQFELLQQPSVEMRLPSDHLSQIVDNLTCGTKYQFTIVALNSVGASAPSEPLLVKTEGSTPIAPDKTSLLSLNSSSVVINLAAWQSGACPMRSFEVLFKPSRAKKWTPLTNYQLLPPKSSPANESSSSSSTANQLAQRSTYASNQASAPAQYQTNSTIVLDDLSSSLSYDLKILATNEAGSTEALYSFNTNGNLFGSRGISEDNGEFQLSEASLSELFAGSGPLLPLLLFLLLVALILSTGCFLLVRRRHTPSSQCSLSLSTASRSNQSSSNYYTSSHHHATRSAAEPKPPEQAMINGRYQQVGSGAACGQTMARNMNVDGLQTPAPQSSGASHMESDLIYGPNQSVAHLAGDKSSNYATYLAGLQANRAPSPQHNLDMASVMNGSEAEMCLGASALDLASQQQQDKQRRVAEQSAINSDPGYYVTGQLLQQNGGKQQVFINQQLNQLGKSCTLPANCHQQQILQQIFQRQSQSGADSMSGGELIDSLVAANMMQQQQQQQQQAAETYLAIQANAAAAAAAAAAASNDHSMASLLEQQLQQQVYATVKRCPRPPRLCDYAIYQCPGGQQQQQPQLHCCDNGAAQINLQHAALNGAEFHREQQQQAVGDYQQLRPIG